MQVCIFEDENYLNFEPLVFSRPVYDLICGVETLKEKILRNYNSTRVALHCRSYLADVVQSSNAGFAVNNIDDGECLFINGKIIADENLAELFPLKSTSDKVFVNGTTVIAAYLSGKNLDKAKANLQNVFSLSDFSGLPSEQIEIPYASYLWDLINRNGKQIVYDFDFITKKTSAINFADQIPSYVHILNKENIFIGNNVTIKPGVVLDASGGPIIIDDNAFIFPNAFIEGPVYIGRNSRIKAGATIYENVSIGKVCKVGGEVEQSIFMDYSNKQHSGFIGHAYIGSWVNLGADTNCSDLKNNYSKVKITLSGKQVDSGSQFLGLMIGDHSKSAINTMFNTGTVVGFSCNIFTPGFPDKYVPSFTWGGDKLSLVYTIDRAMQTAKIVLSRRNINFEHRDETMFKTIFELTKNDREKRGY